MGNSSPLYNPNQRRAANYVPGPATLQQMAETVIAHHTFSLGGLDQRLRTSVTASPVFSAVLTSVIGTTMQDTLALNLRLYPADLAERDLASWERPVMTAEAFIAQLVQNTGRPVEGPVDRYTWINRGVTLLPRPAEDGTLLVDQIAYAGCQLDSSPERFGQGSEIDPMVALHPTKVKNKPPSFTTVKASMGRELWPALDLILPDHRRTVTLKDGRQKVKKHGTEPGTLVSARACSTSAGSPTAHREAETAKAHRG